MFLGNSSYTQFPYTSRRQNHVSFILTSSRRSVSKLANISSTNHHHNDDDHHYYYYFHDHHHYLHHHHHHNNNTEGSFDFLKLSPYDFSE